MGNDNVSTSTQSFTYVENPATSDTVTQGDAHQEHRCKGLARRISQIIGPDKVTKSRCFTILGSVLGFIVFLVFECIAVAYPRRPLLITSGILAFIIFVTLGFLILLDVRASRGAKCAYRRNLGNTVLTIAIAIPFFTLLYAFLWNPSLNRTTTHFSQDSVEQVQFPAVALLQNSKWTSQATLLPSFKCSLGWLGRLKGSPDCDSLPPEQIVPGPTCNCKSGWSKNIVENFIWQNTTYRYLSWQPAANLIDSVPTHLLTLQVSYNYNVSQSLHDSSASISPSLWLAVHDPKLTLTDALKMGYTRLLLISANGEHGLNLSLMYRQAQKYPPAYDYDPSLTTNQNLDIQCDTGSDHYVQPCFVTLYIQFPTFDRKVILQKQVMRWTDVAASAGAFFSFVQFVSWILSGQAMAT